MLYLYHYFDKRTGPFKSLSALSLEEASKRLNQIKLERPNFFCSKRDEDYIKRRKECESLLKEEFLKKGGIIEIDSPHYMVLGESPWLSSWYEETDYIKIPIAEFDLRKLSFTYGDSMPTFHVNDGKEYRNKVYTYEEILKIIEKYGMPQDYNDDGKYGPERYIEVHVWSNETIKRYL